MLICAVETMRSLLVLATSQIGYENPTYQVVV